MDEKTSAAVANLAARGLSNPGSLSPQEVRRLAASALTQARDHEEPDPPPTLPPDS